MSRNCYNLANDLPTYAYTLIIKCSVTRSGRMNCAFQLIMVLFIIIVFDLKLKAWLFFYKQGC